MKKNPLKIVWLTAAFLCLGIGAIGVILPILPTTPFLLVASFCFAEEDRSGFTSGLWGQSFIKTIWTAL